MRGPAKLGGITLAAVVPALLGVAAFASIPDSAGAIHACYGKGGALRVLDDAAGGCSRGETDLTWNQQGPQGAPGPAGPKGDPGPGSRAWGRVHKPGDVSGGTVQLGVEGSHLKTAFYIPYGPGAYCVVPDDTVTLDSSSAVFVQPALEGDDSVFVMSLVSPTNCSVSGYRPGIYVQFRDPSGAVRHDVGFSILIP
jgi:hypothetical protein